MKLESLELKYNKLFSNLKKDSFLSMSALGGEIPFYIVPYNPEQENEIVHKTKQLKQRLALDGISVLEINLFDLSLSMLENRSILDKVIEKERSLSKPKLFKTLQGVLDSETKLIPEIEKLAKDNPSQILFLTGVGQVFPFIRSHTILNNLQNYIKDRPTIMFFPGTYGNDLSLFGKLKDDNYYRAFNLDTLNL
ncbi:MAG: putative cytoplasmic protein [uncultured Sulfurovum sp.]|uniref:Putative cytoplasmic protein n=1 Tax=uncultured Sulfurovum sp. TaxID=269237 RepID=A0A6S6TH19_9BACT|nr:MAG: putative cytoplasmic protein [uncultured Sulfurovum sp.]